MSEIPESIMRAARLAVIAVYIDSDFSPKCERVNRIRSGDSDDELVIQAAARAIMKEREACAKEAESMKTRLAGEVADAGFRYGPNAIEAIAFAIRNR